MRNLRNLAFVICLFTAAFCCGAQADALKLVTLSYPPYEFQDGAKVDGIVVRILHRAFEKLGHQIEIEVLPWKRALLMARQGSADAVFTVYKTEERLKFLDYSKTVIMPQVVSLWALKDAGIEFNGNLLSLENVSIGLVDGVSYGAIADSAIASGKLRNLDYAPSSSQNIKKLLAGRTDTVIMNRYGAIYHLRLQNGFDRVTELRPAISSVPSFIGFSKARNLEKLRDRFDDVLQSMISAGEYQKIIDDYYDEKASSPQH
ncbi:cystine transporter subunit [Roseibium album]|nr:cystine transporter subunit [Roseibium album]